MRRLVAMLTLGIIGCPPSVSLPDTSEGGSGGTSLGGAGSAAGGGQPKDCGALSDACNTGELVDGACVAVPREDGLPCDDGLPCTVFDRCQAGACVAAAPAQCVSAEPCLVPACNGESGLCELVPGNDGLGCDDGDACTQSTVCAGGECVGGSETPCGEDTACARWECDPTSGCLTVPQNVGEACGEPGPCIRFVCSLDGYCSSQPDNTGEPCVDEDPCTVDELCIQGACVGATAPDGMACDDGLACTTNDQCIGGWCSSVETTCGDSTDACVVRGCFDWAESCIGLPIYAEACDHPSACLGAGTCFNGLCGVLDAAPQNDGGACEDGNVCTTFEVCDAGVCVGSPTTACASGDGCCPVGCASGQDADCGAKVYMASTEGLPGFFVFEPDSGTWATLPEPPVPLRSRLTPDGSGVLALGQDSMLYRFDPATSVWTATYAAPVVDMLSSPSLGGPNLVSAGGRPLIWAGADAFSHVGPEWVWLQSGWYGAPAGTFDRASASAFLRATYGSSVLRFDSSTNLFEVWAEDGSVSIDPSCRFGSYFEGRFYATSDPSGPGIHWIEQNGAATFLALVPTDPNPSSDIDPETGLLYIGPSDSSGAFQVLDTATETLLDLPSPPPIPDGYLSSLAVVRAPRTP